MFDKVNVTMNATAMNASDAATLDDDDSSVYKDIVGAAQLYYTPILVALGSVGNCLSILVFFTTNLRKLSSSFYLASLAISDTLFLISVFITWLNMVDINIYNTSIFCKIFTFVPYASCFLSSWLVVAFTVERFIAVSYPLKRPSMCTVTRAKCVIASLTVVALLLYSPYIYISGTETQGNMTMCGPYAETLEVANALNYVDTLLTFVLPFSVIATLNACISRTVWRLARIRRTMTLTVRSVKKMKTSATTYGPAYGTTAARKSSRADHYRPPSSQTKVTKMLLVVSTVFLGLNLPSYVMRVIVYFAKEEGGMSREKENALVVMQHIAYMLFNTNFGINFVLYCVTGQNFRRALTALFCPELARRRTDTTHVTVVSEYLRPSSSVGRHRTLNGVHTGAATTWQDAHEMLPLTK